MGSKESVLLDFVNSYNQDNQIKADWIILTTETISPSPQNPSASFYKKLLSDPQVHWFACLVGRKERKLWMGEVKKNGIPVEMAEIYDVDPLADHYSEKYDRISFLKRNVKHILHY